jgi:hypothetical protein
MKPQFMRVAVLTALTLTTPFLSLAGSQPAPMRTPSRSETQNRTDIPKAVQPGKGSLVTRASVAVTPSLARPNLSDPAFRK